MTEGRLRIYQAAFTIRNILVENDATSEDKRLTRQEVFVATGLDEELFDAAYEYLQKKEHVIASICDQAIWVTQEGRKAHIKEQTRGWLRRYTTELENFKPPITVPLHTVIYNYGSISNSQIQQGTTHSSQSGSPTSISIEELSRLLEELRASLGKLGLSADDEVEAKATIAHAEAQLCSLPQNQGLLRESLGTVKRIFEGAASSTLGSLLAQKIAQVLSSD